MAELAWERKNNTGDPWIALIASQSWDDLDWLESTVDQIAKKYPKAVIVHTGKRAAQGVMIERAEQQGLRTISVSADQKPTYVCWLSDIIMVFYGGTNDTAKEVISKALKVWRPSRKPALHVYEQVRKRKTKSGGGGLTGEIRHKVGHYSVLMKPEEAAARQAKGRM